MTIEGAGGAIKRLLPPEILLSILSWLDPPGLKAAVLVCKVNTKHTPSVAGAQNVWILNVNACSGGGA